MTKSRGKNMPLTPVKTDNIRIELAGELIEDDAFDEITEMDQTKELDMYQDKEVANAKGQLRIVEIEFYE